MSEQVEIKTKRMDKYMLFVPPQIYLKKSVSGGSTLKEKERLHIQKSSLRENENFSTYCLTKDGTMFITGYTLDRDFFDQSTSVYVPINEYCQAFLRENPVDNYSVFIFQKMGVVIVLNQGIVTNYMAGIGSSSRLITGAHELIRSIEVKGFKDTVIFSDEYLDPFNSELVDFDKTDLYKKISKTQKIKNDNVSLFSSFGRAIFASGIKSKKFKRAALVFTAGLLIFLFMFSTVYFLYDSNKKLAEFSSKQAVMQSEIDKNFLVTKNKFGGQEKELKKINAVLSSLGVTLRSVEKGTDSKIIVAKLEDIKDYLKNKKLEAGEFVGAGELTGANELEGKNAKTEKIMEEIKNFSCKVVIQSKDILTCVFEGKSVELAANKEKLLSNGLKARYVPESGAIWLSKSGVEKLTPISLIDR